MMRSKKLLDGWLLATVMDPRDDTSQEPSKDLSASPKTLAEGSSEPNLLGLDNVRLDLPLAGVPSRILAASVDHFFLFLFQVAAIIGGVTLLGLMEMDNGWAIGLVVLSFFLLQWGYFGFFEIALAGRTPGKMVVGLRTVSSLGGRPSVAAFLIRNFMRNFDVIIGVPIMVVDRRHRRLGDLVGGTLVVHHRPEVLESQPTFRHPDDWSAKEVAVVEAFLRRSDRLETDRAQAMAQRLLGWVARRSPELLEEPDVGPTDGILQVDASGTDESGALGTLQRLFWVEA